MLLLPAIDIREGQCVRLYKGKKEETTIYSENPVEVAEVWERMGAKMLHIVDLDAAFTGYSQNLSVVEKIVKSIAIPVQVGGGIRNLETIKMFLDKGVKRVILGTAAINNPELVKEAVKLYDEGIVIGIDSKEGYVAVEGWEAKTQKQVLELACEMAELGVKRVIYTDTSKDGTLEGPNIEATKKLAQETSLNVIASGGISNLEDIKNISSLKPYGVEGVIIGKALYTGNVKLDEALRMVE